MPSGPSSTAATQQHQIATIETQSANMPIPMVTCDFASDVSTSEAADCDGQLCTEKDTLKVSTINASTTPGQSPSASASTFSTNGKSQSPTIGDLKVSPTQARCRALSVGIDSDMVSEFDPSSSDSGVVSRCAVVKPLKFRLCQPIFGKKNHHKTTSSGGGGGGGGCSPSASISGETKLAKHVEMSELEPVMPKVQKPRDPEKEKRRIARKKEKRATLILGLIMGSFIACWLPFFFLYILTPACPRCKIPDTFFAIAFWLGYMNSALNPAIYTIFNKDFRRAFRRILFKWCLAYVCCYRCVARSIEKATERAMGGTPMGYHGYLRR